MTARTLPRVLLPCVLRSEVSAQWPHETFLQHTAVQLGRQDWRRPALQRASKEHTCKPLSYRSFARLPACVLPSATQPHRTKTAMFPKLLPLLVVPPKPPVHSLTTQNIVVAPATLTTPTGVGGLREGFALKEQVAPRYPLSPATCLVPAINLDDYLQES